MAFDNNAISVEVIADTGKAEVTLNQFQQSLQTFTTNYNQTVNNIYQLSEKSRLSFSELATTAASVGVVFSQIKAVVSSITNFVNGFVQLGDAMDKVSLRTGISVESLGGLKFAAEQCGGNARSKVNKIQEPFSLTAGLGKTQNCTLPTSLIAESRSSELTRQRSCNGLLTAS